MFTSGPITFTSTFGSMKNSSCVLVLIGALEDGTKELLAVVDGYRESTQSWRELLQQLKHRGLTVAPKLAIGDGSLGFWLALQPTVFCIAAFGAHCE
jgi:transposase-like protein